MHIGREIFAGKRGAATLLAFCLSLFVHGQVSAGPIPASNSSSYERVSLGKAVFVQRANKQDASAKPAKPSAALAGTYGVRASTHLYPLSEWHLATSDTPLLAAAAHYDARAPPAA